MTGCQYACGDGSTKAWPPSLSAVTPKGYSSSRTSRLAEDSYCNCIEAQLPPVSSLAFLMGLFPGAHPNKSPAFWWSQQFSLLLLLLFWFLTCHFSVIVVIKTPLQEGGVFWEKDPCWVSQGSGVTCGNGLWGKAAGAGRLTVCWEHSPRGKGLYAADLGPWRRKFPCEREMSYPGHNHSFRGGMHAPGEDHHLSEREPDQHTQIPSYPGD